MSPLLELVGCTLAVGASTAAGLAVIPRISDIVRTRQDAKENWCEADMLPPSAGAPTPPRQPPEHFLEVPEEADPDGRRPVRTA